MISKPVILILVGAWWPGNDSSGPNQSIRALCEGLSDSFDFLVISRDRPFGAGVALEKQGVWVAGDHARSCYLEVGPLGASGLARILREVPHDLLLLNGFFDREFTLPALFARRFGRGVQVPVLLSPRGEFTGGALGLKSGRKAVFRSLARAVGLYKGVCLHATSATEADDCQQVLPDNETAIVPNFRPLFPLPDFVHRAPSDPLRLVFLGRISPVKGLDIALRALALCKIPAHLSIYGPVGDASYWRQCEALVAQLPSHVSAERKGEIANAETPAMLAAHDLFLTPSLSENFGHAIFEALASGTPVLIGDQTPWRDLASRKAGHDLPVGDAAGLAAAINSYAAMPSPEQLRWRNGARTAAEEWVQKSPARDAMAALFHRLIASKTG